MKIKLKNVQGDLLLWVLTLFFVFMVIEKKSPYFMIGLLLLSIFIVIRGYFLPYYRKTIINKYNDNEKKCK